MTNDQADQRIQLSQNTLAKFEGLMASGVDPMPGTIRFMTDEIAVLEQLAADHPEKISALVPIIAGWASLCVKLKARLN